MPQRWSKYPKRAPRGRRRTAGGLVRGRLRGPCGRGHLAGAQPGWAAGRIALAYNPSRTERTLLAVAISEDNGLTWPRQRLLESGPGEFSYPAIIQTSDRLIHVVYTHRCTTIQHVVLDAEWIDII